MFAHAPLPDDFIFPILGTANHSLPRALIPSVLGKALMVYTTGFVGYLIGDITSSLADRVPVAITLALFSRFVGLVELIDWERMLERYSRYFE